MDDWLLLPRLYGWAEYMQNVVYAIDCSQQIRVSGYGGWFLLRLSLHDPVLPLNVEVGAYYPTLCFHTS